MYDKINLFGIAEIPMIALILNIGAAVMLIAASICTGIFLHKNSVLQKAAFAVKDNLEKSSLENAIADRHGEKAGFFWRMIRKPRQLFLYSGLSRIFPKLTFETFTSLAVTGGCTLFFIGDVMTKDLFVASVSTGIYTVALLAVQYALSYSNYKTTDSHLISFLNQLSNFSQFGTAEVTDVFLQVAKYMPNPMRQVLEECYAEAQISGNTVAALEACADKLEHPKFKEIIKNIEACLKYTADYKIVVDSMRSGILDERRSAQERKSMASSSAVQMAIVTVMGIIIMVIAQNGLGMDIVSVVTGSAVGRFTLITTAASYIVFFWSMMKAHK